MRPSVLWLFLVSQKYKWGRRSSFNPLGLIVKCVCELKHLGENRVKRHNNKSPTLATGSSSNLHECTAKCNHITSYCWTMSFCLCILFPLPSSALPTLHKYITNFHNQNIACDILCWKYQTPKEQYYSYFAVRLIFETCPENTYSA